MSRIACMFALVALATVPVAGAQQRGGGPGGPGAPGGRGGPPGMTRGEGPSPASMLLASTGELKLTDAQVTRLAAIARRSAERRSATRSAMDSMMMQMRPAAPGVQPAGPPPAARALMERIRTQQHEDLRDALAVLNADQQATAFELMHRRQVPPPRRPDQDS